MKKSIMARLGLSMSMVMLVAGGALAAEVALWGSTTCQKRFLEPGADALAKATGVNTKVYGVGTGKGMLALFDGKTDVAIASSTLESAVSGAQKAAKKEGKPEVAVPDNLQFHKITEDVIVPIVHQDNPVDSLSWEQLAALNTGKVTNWKDVGGSDVPVQVVNSHAGSSTRGVFQKMVMKKEPFVTNMIEVKSTRLEINEVSKDPGAIGAVSEGFVKLNPGKTKVVKTDTISRPLGLITIGDPTPEVQKVIDFYRSAEGKKYILD